MRRWIVLGTLCLCMLMVAMDANILHTVMPTLIRELRPTTIEQLWIVNAYALLLAGLLITMGALSDRYGRRRILLGGLVVFGLASLLAEWVRQPWQAIACRAVLGVGGAMIMPTLLSLIRETFGDAKERTIALSACGMAGCAGAALGPVLGGSLVHAFDWQAAFLVNVVIVLVAVPLVAVTVRESVTPRVGVWDWTSVALSFVGMTAVVQGIKLLGKPDAPVSESAAMVAVGITTMAWFVHRQWRSSDPLLDLRLFGARSFTAGVAVYAVVMFSLSSTIYLASQWLQFVHRQNAMGAGLWLLPATLSALLAVLAVPYSLARWHVRDVMLAGMASITVALFIPALNHSGSLVAFAISLACLGAGVSLALSSATTVVVMAAPAERAGSAAALQSTAYEVGNVLGIAVVGSFAARFYTRAVPVPDGLVASMARAVRRSVGEAEVAAAGLPQSEGILLQQAVSAAFDKAFSVSCLLVGCAMLVFTLSIFALVRKNRFHEGIGVEAATNLARDRPAVNPGAPG